MRIHTFKIHPDYPFGGIDLKNGSYYRYVLVRPDGSVCMTKMRGSNYVSFPGKRVWPTPREMTYMDVHAGNVDRLAKVIREEQSWRIS